MATQPQIQANRQNAQKSTGPKTPEGKAVVSQNALKHGLSARRDVVITESQAEFDLHRDSLLAELDPQGPMESILADRIVTLSWRLKRAEAIQNQTIDAMHEKSQSNPLAKLAKSLARLRTHRFGSRPDSRPNSPQRLRRHKSPRPPPDVRAQNRAQPLQNNPRAPKPPTPLHRPQSHPRFTRYASRFTKYASRSTLNASRCAKQTQFAKARN